jgi:hypothetical protein
LAKFRREARSPLAKLADGATVVAGGALAGALDVYAPASVMGIPTDAVVAIALLGAGMAQGSPTFVLAASGVGASIARDQVRNGLAGLQAG